MSRKDFVLIAEVIRTCKIDKTSKDVVINRFCAELRGTNPLFDSSRFIAACKGDGK